MFLPHGQRAGRIKTFTEHHQPCHKCKSFDLGIRVYRNYYHVLYIPIFGFGPKTAYVRCNNCGERNDRIDITHTYEKKARTPFYFYSWPLLILLTIAGVATFLYINEFQKTQRINSPRVGDVYTIKTNMDKLEVFYFARVTRVTGDSVFTWRNHLAYIFQSSGFEDKDFFSRDQEVSFARTQLKQMLKDEEIQDVYRGYGNSTGFNRVQ